MLVLKVNLLIGFGHTKPNKISFVTMNLKTMRQAIIFLGDTGTQEIYKGLQESSLKLLAL